MHDNGNLLNLSLGTALLLAVVVVAHIFLIRQVDTAFLIPNFVLFFYLSFSLMCFAGFVVVAGIHLVRVPVHQV